MQIQNLFSLLHEAPCLELVLKSLEYVIRPEVTLCGWQDVNIQELIDYESYSDRRKAAFTSDTSFVFLNSESAFWEVLRSRNLRRENVYTVEW